MNARRTLTRLAAFIALALVAAACGDDAADDADGETVELTLQHMEVQPNRVDAFQEVIDGFNDAQDQFVFQQETVGWDEAYQRATAQISAGEQPDMLQAIPAFFTTIRETDAVQPATEMMDSLSQDHDFIEAYSEQYEWDDEVWAVPAFGMLEQLWYNEAHFAEAGLEPPETWDEMLEVAEELTTDDRYGFVGPSGDSFATVQSIYTWMGTAGGEDIYDDSCEPIVNNQEVIDTFDFYNQLQEFSPPDSPAYDWAETEGALVAGNASMMTFKGSFLDMWHNESEFEPEDLGVAPIPQPEGGQDFTLSYSNAFMVMTDDPDRQEGIQAFMDYFLTPEIYGEWLGTAEPGLFLPVTEEGLDADEWWNAETISAFEDQVRTTSEASPVGQLYGFTQDAYCPQVGEFEGQDLLGKAVEQMVVNELSPEEAVEWLESEMQTVD